MGLYLKFDFSNNIFASIGYSYWQSNTIKISGSNLNIPPETINSNGAKFELDFSLIENNHISLLLGPSLLIEGVSTSHSTTFTYGAQLKLNYALLENKIFLVSTLAYQNGGGIFDLAGGGFNYSFFNFLTGIEVNLSK